MRGRGCPSLLFAVTACSVASAAPDPGAAADPPCPPRAADAPAPLPPAAAASPSPTAGVGTGESAFLAGCTHDVDTLPVAPGASERDTARLHTGRVLVAHKSARRMMLFDGGTLQACWRIGLGFAPSGTKQIEGDGKTPEGWYRTSDKPWSAFEHAIAIHYPAVHDAAAARAAGRIDRGEYQAISAADRRGTVPPQRTAMGGAVLIHGGGSGSDWTLGCIALTDADLLDVRARLPARMRTHVMIVE